MGKKNKKNKNKSEININKMPIDKVQIPTDGPIVYSFGGKCGPSHPLCFSRSNAMVEANITSDEALKNKIADIIQEKEYYKYLLLMAIETQKLREENKLLHEQIDKHVKIDKEETENKLK